MSKMKTVFTSRQEEEEFLLDEARAKRHEAWEEEQEEKNKSHTATEEFETEQGARP